jgi:hypothetical protein
MERTIFDDLLSQVGDLERIIGSHQLTHFPVVKEAL